MGSLNTVSVAFLFNNKDTKMDATTKGFLPTESGTFKDHAYTKKVLSIWDSLCTNNTVQEKKIKKLTFKQKILIMWP